jgi:Peptidase M50B-like
MPLPGSEAALIGLAALAVVIAQFLWPCAEHVNVMAHEGAHAMTASVLGFPVLGIRLNPDATGETSYFAPAYGLRRVAVSFVGYLGPSAFGLGAAKLIVRGHIIAVLWLSVVFLVLLLLNLAPPSFGFVSVPAAIVVLCVLIRYGSAGLDVVMAYSVTWLLLLSGVRVAVQDGASAGDAATLRTLTRLPRLLWALLWLAVTLEAVLIGGRILLLRG